MPKESYIRTPEIREKTRQTLMGHNVSLETREKLRQFNLGKKLSLTTIEKIRQASMGRCHSPESKEKIRQANLGNKRPPLTEEWKEKIKQVMSTPEAKERNRQAHLGKKHSLEQNEKMRQFMLGNTYSLGFKHTDEAKEKIRQARLKQILPTKMTSIEIALCDEFKKRRLKFEMHKTMFGRFQPDFVFEDCKLVVHADGDYWHSLPARMESDKHCDELAHEAGYTVFRFTETVIKQNAARCARTVARFIHSC